MPPSVSKAAEGGAEFGHFGVAVTAGRLRLQACDVESLSQSCVCVRGAGAAPTLTGCTLHGARAASGLIFCEEARGSARDCHLMRNGYGVAIASGANPTVARNRVHDSAHAGVYCCGQGTLGRLEGNNLFDNVLAGLVMGTGARPTVLSNRIHDQRGAGAVIVDAGTEGVLEKNDVYDNDGGRRGGGSRFIAWKIQSTGPMSYLAQPALSLLAYSNPRRLKRRTFLFYFCF